jgi:hypothetical protein
LDHENAKETPNDPLAWARCPVCGNSWRQPGVTNLHQWAERQGGREVRVWGPFHEECIKDKPHGRIGPSRVLTLEPH